MVVVVRFSFSVFVERFCGDAKGVCLFVRRVLLRTQVSLGMARQISNVRGRPAGAHLSDTDPAIIIIISFASPQNAIDDL
jgi:hypothetical protein